MFYDKYLALCVEKGVAPTYAAEAIGMTGSHVTRWKKGSVPLDTTIVKIAQYFGVDPEYFDENNPQKKKIKKAANNGGTDEAREYILNSPGFRALFEASKGVPDSRLYEAAAQLAKWKEDAQGNAD